MQDCWTVLVLPSPKWDSSFFYLRQQDVRKKSTSPLIQQVDRLINKLFKDATTMQEVSDKLCFAKIHYIITTKGKQFLDGRRIMSKTELCEALQSWEATDGSLVPDDGQTLTRMKYRPIASSVGNLVIRRQNAIRLVRLLLTTNKHHWSQLSQRNQSLLAFRVGNKDIKVLLAPRNNQGQER